MRSIMSCLMLSGSSFLPVTPVDQGSDFALAKPIEGECSDVGSSDPWRVELGSVRYDQQYPERLYPVHGPPKHFKAGRVDPMHVLENHQHRVGTRQRFELRS